MYEINTVICYMVLGVVLGWDVTDTRCVRDNVTIFLSALVQYCIIFLIVYMLLKRMMSDLCVPLMKNRFYEELKTKRNSNAKNCVYIDDGQYTVLINDVNNAKSTTKKVPRDYWLLKRYDILTINQKTKLIFPVIEYITMSLTVNYLTFYMRLTLLSIKEKETA